MGRNDLMDNVLGCNGKERGMPSDLGSKNLF